MAVEASTASQEMVAVMDQTGPDVSTISLKPGNLHDSLAGRLVHVALNTIFLGAEALAIGAIIVGGVRWLKNKLFPSRQNRQDRL